jgi:hypothetical protein
MSTKMLTHHVKKKLFVDLLVPARQISCQLKPNPTLTAESQGIRRINSQRTKIPGIM